MINPGTNEGVVERRELEAAAKAVAQQLFVIEISADRDLEPAFAAMVERKAGALLIGSGPFLTGRQRQLAALALRHQLPAARSLRGFAVAGGLMSYSASITDAYRQAGLYAGRILKGEKPADLPVRRPASSISSSTWQPRRRSALPCRCTFTPPPTR